ncbi:MAG: CerR family C-terminal domain-containing protein [Planctomycetaceae bacterium]|nr:CerR family C-terminal domain-containing protein [Planctomycetaceae bacterium]
MSHSVSPQVPSTDEDTRTRLLQAAGLVFAEKGFQRATVREICDAADVNIAGVNYHFGDKRRLYIEAVKRAHQLRTQRVPLPSWSENTSGEIKLRGFIRTLLTRMIASEEAPWQHRLMMQEILHPTQACREMVEDYIRPEFELLLSILAEMMPENVPVARRHQFAFSVVGQCLFYKIGSPVARVLVDEDEFSEHFNVEQLANHISDVCLAALGVTSQFSDREMSSQSNVT